ncbi:MAG: TolB family protein [Thermoanaerobaculia bacterium]
MKRALLAGFLLLPSALTAQAPSADWRTIETAHFRVHYPVPFEAWAKRTAASLEAIHAAVADFVGYAPPRPIDVVVADPRADANGIAFPFLDRPVVVLWAFPPEAESGIGDFTDWMDLVSVHEIAHIAHLTWPRNRPGLLSRFLPLPLGPVLLRTPRWAVEGYATLVEGALTGSGRPNSSFRAMVLRRFAIEGKLPSYGALSGTSGWLGGAMSYLVGSSYLEWLEEREGAGSLSKLWKRIASRRGGDFATAFRAVFGRPPSDLYDRFRAELTAQAIEEEKRREAAGLQGGELWQRLEGGTGSPQVSPDGRRLLARRAPRRGESFLGVWLVEETPEERRAEEKRRKKEEELLADPNEVADKPEIPRRREPRWKLARWNGEAPEDPRWMPDSRRVLFSRRAPDGEGVVRLDLFLWDVESGEVSRVTRLQGVGAADPAPDGSWAAAVRNRYGISELVRVDLATGQTRALDTGTAPKDRWRVWSHPRLSPDGSTIAALLHEGGEWRLVTLPAAGGAPRTVARSAVGPPAWSPDGSRIHFGSDASGVWEIASVDREGSETPAISTRVTGGASSPAPSPDGSALFFLAMTGRGVDLRRLLLPAEPVGALPREAEDFPILPPPRLETKVFPASELPEPRAYDALSTRVVRLASGFSAGPSGNSWQTGVQGSDVVGRLDWLALGAFGNAAGPRGGSAALAWSGLPAKVSLHLFSSLEKPGSQRLARRPELDQQRWGGFANASWGRPYDGGRVEAELGGGWTRFEALADEESFSRAVASTRLAGELLRTWGRSGFSAALEAAGSLGDTAGGFWRQFFAQGRVAGITSLATLGVSARYGDTGGSPTRFDLFRIGGVDSSILPPGLDRNRVWSPALPAALQLGPRLETYRADLAFSGVPLLLYAERLRAWDPSLEKPDMVRVEGVELRFERLVSLGLPDSLRFYVGVARIRSQQPQVRSTQGYGGLVYRP